MRFFVDTAGQFSGGGRAVLSNCTFAARRHSILAGSREAGDIPFIMRNVPARGISPAGEYVLGPQNALPWTRHAHGLKERALVSRLRIASEWYGRRASALFRSSSAIPQLTEPCSPVLHNVLDTGFDQAAVQSAQARYQPAVGRIVSIGSGHSYRNLGVLLDGYERYRSLGGKAALFVGGVPGSARAQRDIELRAAALPDVRLQWGAIARPEFLAALRDAAAVVLPSLVEASPLTALEAFALTPRVVLSDIIGHREVLAPFGSDTTGDPAFFSPTSPEELADALLGAESGGAGAGWHAELSSPERRAGAREEWADTLAAWLTSLDVGGGGTRG